jgi:hypothetical protein
MGLITLKDAQPYKGWADAMVDTKLPGDIIVTNNMTRCSDAATACTTWDDMVIHVRTGDSQERKISFLHELGHLHHVRMGEPPMPPNCTPAWDHQEGWAWAFVRCALGDRSFPGTGINCCMPAWTQLNYDNVAEWFRNAEAITT